MRQGSRSLPKPADSSGEVGFLMLAVKHTVLDTFFDLVGHAIDDAKDAGTKVASIACNSETLQGFTQACIDEATALNLHVTLITHPSADSELDELRGVKITGLTDYEVVLLHKPNLPDQWAVIEMVG